MRDLVPTKPAQPPGRSVLASATQVVPTVIAEAGEMAARRFMEFFAATIRNRNTRMAYYRDVRHFFAWCEHHQVGRPDDIEPLHIAAYVEQLQGSMAKPSVKQHLAAIRMLFDWLVTGQVLAINPAHAVRGPKHVVKRGKTPVLTSDQARELLDSIDTSTLIGLRDRALIGVMTYAFARVGAVVAMRVEDYFANGKRWWVRLHEKGGKQHEMPAHHKLEAFIDEYLEAAGIAEAGKSPLFRAAMGRARTLSLRPMHRVDAYRMVQRRALKACLPVLIGCHTFRATGITAYLEAGGSLENAQAMAAPATRSRWKRSSGYGSDAGVLAGPSVPLLQCRVRRWNECR